MSGQMVEFASNGGMTAGYLSIPEKGAGPGVVVIQEWWGLVGHIKDVCDRFAAEGYVALAPDLYHGERAKSPDEAGKLMMALRIDEAEKEMRGIAAKLANPQFLERAPAEIIDKEREKQRELAERRATLERNLERLSSL